MNSCKGIFLLVIKDLPISWVNEEWRFIMGGEKDI